MIKVDENKCIGCGACVAIDPEHFDFNENGLSKVISQDLTNFSADVVDSCPVGAITVEEAAQKDNIIELKTPAKMESTEDTEESEDTEQIAA